MLGLFQKRSLNLLLRLGFVIVLLLFIFDYSNNKPPQVKAVADRINILPGKFEIEQSGEVFVWKNIENAFFQDLAPRSEIDLFDPNNSANIIYQGADSAEPDKTSESVNPENSQTEASSTPAENNEATTTPIVEPGNTTEENQSSETNNTPTTDTPIDNSTPTDNSSQTTDNPVDSQSETSANTTPADNQPTPDVAPTAPVDDSTNESTFLHNFKFAAGKLLNSFFKFNSAIAQDEPIVAETSDNSPSSTSISINQKLEFSDYTLPPDSANGELGQVRLMVSMSGKSKLAKDKIVFEYNIGDEWKRLDEIEVNQLGQPHTEYLGYDLSDITNWGDIGKLKTRISYNYDGEDRPKDESLYVYLDALWLEISYDQTTEKTDEQKDYELNDLFDRKDFKYKDELKFRFQYKRINRNIFTQIGYSILGLFSDEYKDIQINAKLSAPGGKDNPSLNPVVRYIKDGEFEIEQPKSEREFRPGKYSLEIEIKDGEQIYIENKEFTWGVLAINTNKSIYLTGEKAKIQMAVLNDLGHTICDAELHLEITTPNGEQKILDTSDNSIIKDQACGPDNVIDTPDYWADFQTGDAGVYMIKLTASTDNGVEEITDSFEVRNEVPFEIERIGPTRIYPKASYGIDFKIKANVDYQGEFKELVPRSFMILSSDGAEVWESDDAKKIIWPVDWRRGQTYLLRYTFDAPDISPEFYLLGPAKTGEFEEARSWQIASDATAKTVYAESVGISAGTTDTTNWTDVVIASSTQFTGGNRYFVYVSAGFSSNNANADTDYAIDFGGLSTTTGLVEGPSQNHANDAVQISWIGIYDQPATATDITLKYRTNANTSYVQNAQIFALNLSDLSSDDYKYATNTTNVAHGTAMAARSTITLDKANGTKDWLVFGMEEVQIDNTAVQTEAELFDGSNAYMGYSQQGEDTNEQYSNVLFRPFDNVVLNTQFSIRSRDSAVNANQNNMNTAMVFALNLSAFENNKTRYQDINLALSTSPNYSYIGDLNTSGYYTPTYAGDQVVFASFLNNARNAAAGTDFRIQVSSTTVPTGWSWAQAPTISLNYRTANDQIAMNVMDQFNITATGVPIALQATEISQNQTGDEYSMAIFSTEKYNNLTISADNQYKNDGTTAIANGDWTDETTVKLKASSITRVGSASMKFYFELIPSANTFQTATSEPSSYCTAATPYNSCFSKIWLATSTVLSSNASGTIAITGMPETDTYKWQVKAFDNAGYTSDWRQFNTSVPNFKVDATAPTAPGNLTEVVTTGNSTTLGFGSQTTELNFDRYRIFYKVGTTTVTESDTEHADSNLNYKDYNSQSSTVVSGLNANTTYTFNIWAYDSSGKKASATQLTITTKNTLSVTAYRQYKSDTFTIVPNQGWTDESQIYLSGLANTVSSTTSRFDYYFELLDESASFTTSTSTPSSTCSSGTGYNDCSSKIWKTSATTTSWYDVNWKYRKKITINASKVIADITGFPILATTTDSDLAYTGFGGNMASSTGGDIVITDSSGTTTLNYQREYYASSTGQVVLWVKSNLSSAANTILYLYYGNSSNTSVRSTTTGVWSANNVIVYHMDDNPAGGATIHDSSPYNEDATSEGSMTSGDLVNGYIGRALDFDGNGDYIRNSDGNNSAIDTCTGAGQARTWSYWLKLNAVAENKLITDKSNFGASNLWSELHTGSRNIRGGVTGTGQLVANTTFVQDTWYYITWKYDGAATYLYVNGQLDMVGAQTSDADNNNTFYIMGYTNASYTSNGVMDEFRLLNVSEATTTIQTEYNNQSSVGTFMTFGDEESISLMSYEGQVNIASIPDRGIASTSNGYKWQVMTCSNDGTCSTWNNFNSTMPNFRVDTTPPTAPGDLTYSTSTPTSLTLNYGATTTEANFDSYKIFYKSGVSGVETTDTQHIDSSLGYIDYNSAIDTTITGLEANTQYVINIWAYDLAGNKTSATELVQSTPSAPHARARSVLFLAGNYSGNGSTGQTTDTNQTFSAFNFRLPETDVAIRDAYIIFEAQYEAYHSNSSDYTGYNLSFDSCEEPCTASAFGTNAITVDDNSILSYSESGGNQIRIIYDVSNQSIIKNYVGDNANIQAQVGYRLETGSATTSIANAKAVLVLTYSYNHDESTYYANTIIYPLESSVSGDSGSRRSSQADSCTKNSNCPKFTYKIEAPELDTMLSQWFQMYGINDNNGANDININVNIEGRDVDSNTIIYEAANNYDQSSLPQLIFNNVEGYQENTASNQTLEFYAGSSGATYYTLGGEAVDTYFAAKSASVKTRTVSFPLGVLTNGQSVSTASATASVYFPENGLSTGVVTVKKAWLRVAGNDYNDSAYTVTLSSKVGDNTQSGNYIYNLNVGSEVIRPSYYLIHVIPSTDYAELAKANASTPKNVTLFSTNSTSELGGISAELMITYTYSDETNGYLSSLNVYGGQSGNNANSTSDSLSTAKSVFPELRGTKTLRSSALLSSYLLTDSDGDNPATWFTLGSNIATSSPSCTNSFGFRTDGVNSFAELYNSISLNQFNTVDKTSYLTCYSNYNSMDDSAGAKMNGIWLYTYQWDAPPSEFTQNSWRWYENIDSIQPTTAKASETVAVTGINKGEAVRLRMNIIVSKENLATSSQTFKLQFGKGSNCATVSDWSDVGAIGGSDAWLGYNNPTPLDATDITSALLASSTVIETYEETNPTGANPRGVVIGQYGEWDWTIYNNDASSSADYCFRMIKGDGNVLTDYLTNSYPKLTTAPANTAPNAPSSLAQYRNNGTTTIANTGWTNEQYTSTTSVVKLTAGGTDPNISESLTLYYELIPNANTFTTATTVPASVCASTTHYDNCTSKIWSVSTPSTGDYRTSPFVGTSTIIGIPNSASGYKWQVMTCDDDSVCSDWAQFASGPNFRVDVTPPTNPGTLTFNQVNALNIILGFGATTTETNFSRYRIYYKVGTSTVTQSDFEHSDSDLLNINFNYTSTTTVLSLSAGTTYSFKIWAYDLAGNSASSTQVSTTTLSSYSKPDGSLLTMGQKTDGSGSVDIAISASDPDNDNTLRAKLEYQFGSGCGFATSAKATIDTIDANTTANLGADPKVDNGSAYQVGTTTGYIWTSLGPNTVFFDWLSGTDLPNIEGTYCLRLTINDNTISGDQATPTAQSIYVDNKKPITPGALSLATKNYNSVRLAFGTQSSDTSFSEYKIFYKTGSSGVTEGDSAWTKTNDAYLGAADFFGATSTLITGLTPNTQYVFAIWAYDAYGNKASSTEFSVKTNAKPINISASNQYLSDGSTAIANGALIDDNTVYLKALVHDQDTSDLVTFYYQLITSTSTYITATSVPGSTCSSGTAFNSCSSKVWAISTTTSLLPTDWYNSNWLYRKKITINSSQVLTTESNFPVLATTTDSSLAANARSDGYDILFTSSDGTTTIPYEREYYNNSTGELVAWVKTNISSTTNTEIYMYYGNSGSITDNSTTTGVWDTSFKGVWHLKEEVVDEGNQNNIHIDSTANANYGSQYGNNELTSKIYRGQDFDGINDYISFADSASLDITDALTMEFWINGAISSSISDEKVTITTTGSSNFYIPQGVTQISVKAWGGGGAGGAGADGGTDQTRNPGGNGAGAGFAGATLSVTPGEALSVVVGGGGVGGSVRGGGRAGDGGGGGGRSEINRSGTQLVVAAGGGGGGGGNNYTYSPGANGGPGGGISGTAGSNADTVTGGGGGTQTAGGAGGNGANDGSTGAASTGGAGADGRNAEGVDGSGPSGGTGGGGNGGLAEAGANRYPGGGGGGSGYYGGGGGGENANSGTTAGSGGGGGSCYLTGTATSTNSGSGQNAGNNTDSDYASNAGRGGAGGNYGAAGSAGNGGLVVITYKPSIVLAGKGYAYQINLNTYNYISGSIGSTTVMSTTTTSAWHHVALSYDRSAGGTEEMKLYIDGNIKSTSDYSTAIATNNNNLKLGEVFDGLIDEYRISNTARSYGWLKSGYRNQTSVGSFMSFGSESTVTSYYENVMVITIPDSGTGYKWQVMACDDDNDCSGWGKFNAVTPNFKVDTQPPTAPGNLTENTKTSNSITLNFGSASSDVNFDRYRIYYSTTNPVTESGTEHSDSNLLNVNYNSASVTTISGLDSNTTYYFNIWAYDTLNHKASATQLTVSTANASSSPGVIFYTRNSRILYYKTWDGMNWSTQKTGPTLGSAAGDNIRQIRTVRSDDGGKVAVLVKTWDGVNQEWWGTVYRYAADDFVNSTQLGSAEADATNNQLITGCLAALSGGEFMVVRNNNASAGTLVYSWDGVSGWTSEGAGPNPNAVLNGCSFTRRPGTDNYILMTFDDDADVGSAYYYGGSTYANSWTSWTEHSTNENDIENYAGSAYFDPKDNTKGAVNFTNSATAQSTQAKYFTCSSNSMSFGSSSSTPATYSGNFVHGEFATDSSTSSIAYFAGRDTNNELNVYKVTVGAGTTPVWSSPSNSDDISGSTLYDEANYSQKPFAITFYKPGKGVVAWNYNLAILSPQYSVIDVNSNSLDASASNIPDAGTNMWTRMRFYNDPSENEFAAVLQNDDIDYGIVFWDGRNNRFYNSTDNPGSKQIFTEIATTTGAFDRDDENTSFAYTKYNSAPLTPTSLVQYKSDAITTISNGSWTNSNTLVLSSSVKDYDTSEVITTYVQFIANADTFATTTSQPTNTCANGTDFTTCTSKIWVAATSTTGDYSTTGFSTSTRITSIPDSASGYKWQVIACDDSGVCSSWAKYNTTIPNVKVDATPPTAPGSLTIAGKTSYSITLNFGATSTESNFSEYRIYYSSSTPVTLNSVRHTDSDLSFINYNNTTNTIVLNLSSSTLYYFNIWAYDLAGNIATATTEAYATTSAPSNLRQMSYRFENDNSNGVNTNTAVAAADTPLTGVPVGERLITRIQIDNDGGDAATNKVYKLQYENLTDTPGVWVDVGSATQTSYALGLSGSTGDAITGPITTLNAKTWANGLWQENTNTTANYSLTNGYYTELAFVFNTGNATGGKTYRLRIYNNTDGQALSTYNNYPTFTTATTSSRVISKNSVAALSSGTTALSYYLDPLGYSNVLSDDSVYDIATSSSNIPVFQFVIATSTNTLSPTATWNGQSSVAASTRSIFLQIYRFGTTNAWVTVATNTTATADTDFNLSGGVNYKLSEFYDSSYRSYWRVYQSSGSQVVRTDSFSVSYSTPTPSVQQYHYRWRYDNGSETGATWREAWDTADPTLGSNLVVGTNVRLRFVVANVAAGTSTNYAYQIEYASTTSGCATDPGGWIPIPATSTTQHFNMATTTNFNNGDSTTATSSNSEGYTWTTGRMVKNPSSTTSVITLLESRYTEIEYVFKANSNATAGGDYCFRVTNAGTALNTYSNYAELVLAGNTNTAPSFTTYPSDGGSATNTPTNYGSNVAFTATAQDTQGDQYYLAICRTNSITAGNDAAPTCNGGNWCISATTTSGAPANCSYTTATTSESVAWYAFVCDKRAGASIAKCSSVSQGGTGVIENDSPFVVNHAPVFSSVSTIINNIDPGQTYKIGATTTETDSIGSADSISMYVCYTNSASAAGCTGGVSDTVCSVTGTTTSNPYCNYTSSIPTTAGSVTYYAFVYDNHSMAASANSRSSTYTIRNSPPTLNTLVLNGNAAITLNLRGASDKQVQTINTDIDDLNGCSTFISATAVVYMSNATNGYNCTASDNDCYQITTASCVLSDCSGASDRTGTYTCTANLKYHAIPTDNSTNNPYETYNWLSRIVVNDNGNLTATTSAGVELNTSQALDINENAIDYGSSLQPGQNTGTTNQPSTVINSGNCPINTDIAGTDMAGNPSGTIVVTNQKYSLTSGFNYLTQGTILGYSAASLDVDVPRATSTMVSDIIYWGIGVPFSSPKSLYNGQNSFTSSLDYNNWN